MRRGIVPSAVRSVFAVFCLGSAAFAEDVPLNPGLIEHCEASVPELLEREACIGLGANHCMDVMEGGHSTVGTNGCLDAEWQYWDGRLNVHYGEAMARAKAFDVDMAAEENGLLSAEETLRDMQRAWIAFRDARCEFVRAQWSGGTGQGPAMLSCLMQETGRQALWLQVQAGNM